MRLELRVNRVRYPRYRLRSEMGGKMAECDNPRVNVLNFEKLGVINLLRTLSFHCYATRRDTRKRNIEN